MHIFFCSSNSVRKTAGNLVLNVILVSWKVIGYSKKEINWILAINLFIILDYISLRDNKLPCFVNNKNPFKVHNMMHRSWKKVLQGTCVFWVHECTKSLNKLHRSLRTGVSTLSSHTEKKWCSKVFVTLSMPKKNSVRPPRVKRLTGQKDLDWYIILIWK